MSHLVLYEPNTQNFTSNGLGVLNEVISPIVTEERNGIYELTFRYPVTGKRYAQITYSSIIRCPATPQGDYQAFRIYAISKPKNGIVTYSAEHISYQLAYIACDAFTATTCAEAFTKIKNKAMSSCPFTFWTDKSTVANYKQETPENMRARLGGVSGSILDVYGGEYEWDNYTVKLHNHRGADRGVTLRYGKNITDIEQEENIGEVYTSIVGYWKSEDEVIKTAVIDSEYANSYPYKRTKVVDFSSDYQEAPTVAQLNSRCTSYMNSNNFGIPRVSIKVSFAALWQTEEYKNIAPLERVYLCDTVSVYFEKLGISASSKVVKTIYNVLLDRYDAIELGETRTNLSKRLADNENYTEQKLDETKSELEKSIDRATQLITGNRGGHIITRMDANGKPTELLIMDTDDIQTAQKVWRFNLAGWGYSSTGINGPYRLAARQDGHINADFIDTGTLTANVIKAGILSDSEGKNFWNMVTGEFQLASTATIGGKTSEQIADEQLSAWVTSTYSPDKTNLQNQIDGKAETWYQSTDPSTAWNTAEKKAKHEGDLWYNTTNGTTWFYGYNEALERYEWAQENVPEDVFDKIDGKAQIFASTSNPTPPYNVGDLWFKNTSTGIKTCKVAKAANQQFAASDWEERNKYVGESDVNTLINSYDGTLNQQKVFDKLTNNGQTQGIYLHNGLLYINAAYIATGLLTDAKGKFKLNMETGVLEMKDGSFSGSITGSTITGSRIQSADTGARVFLDTSASIKGSDGSLDNNQHLIVQNLINFAQVVSGSTQMTIDAATQLNIRTPHLYVTNQSYGTGTGTVYEAINDRFTVVTDVSKYNAAESDARELWVDDAGGDGDVYCTLPVYLKWTKWTYAYIHGMRMSGGASTSQVI